jgi:hypothetical protein
MPTSTIYQDDIVNVARGVAVSSWTPFLAIFLGDPQAGGVEVSGGGYARQAVTLGAPVNGVSTNSSLIQFPLTTDAGYGLIAYWALMTAAVAGSVKYVQAVSGTETQRTIGPNRRVTIQAGQLSVRQT